MSAKTVSAYPVVLWRRRHPRLPVRRIVPYSWCRLCQLWHDEARALQCLALRETPSFEWWGRVLCGAAVVAILVCLPALLRAVQP